MASLPSCKMMVMDMMQISITEEKQVCKLPTFEIGSHTNDIRLP